MGRHGRSTSPPPRAALAGPLLLLIICVFLFHCGADAARPLTVHHAENNGVKDAADGLVVLPDGATRSGDELLLSEVMVESEEMEEACEEGNDECMQRRLLRDAHLDYIYTQHKGKP